MGLPWPSTALAASMPLNPLHTDSAHPPDGTLSPCMALNRSPDEIRGCLDMKAVIPDFIRATTADGIFQSLQFDSYSQEFRKSARPRQEAEWRCRAGGRAAWMAARGITGQGRPVYAGPEAAPEGGKSGHRPDPDVGGRFLLLTFLCANKEK